MLSGAKPNPKGPRTQIIGGLGAQIKFYSWYLGAKTLLFGSLDPNRF